MIQKRKDVLMATYGAAEFAKLSSVFCIDSTNASRESFSCTDPHAGTMRAHNASTHEKWLCLFAHGMLSETFTVQSL